jgi:malonyl-CoA O-methyltransferase
MTDNHKIDIDNTAGYDRWAAFYDSYPNPTVAADDRAFPALWASLRDCDVLEIGCGTGRHTVRLAQENRVTGIDISAGMLDAARAKLPPSVRLVHGDFMVHDGFASASFDAAVMSLVLEHIAELPAFFMRLANVLRPGASFFVSEIHPARTADGVFAHFRDGDAEYHLSSHPHTQDAVIAAARAAGMDVAGQHDVMGDAGLAALNPKWAKYDGLPMIRMWAFRRGA